MKPVLVTQRIEHLADRGETRDCLDQALCRLIIQIGGLPIPVPNNLIEDDALTIWLQSIAPAAIVLSGGGDIDLDCPRAQTELALMDYAEAEGLPLLGICRGMQAMALRAGSSLTPITGHVRQDHRVTGTITATVNSFHDYALDAVPEGYALLAKAEDGVIEAIAHQNLPWEGWMWHPERVTPFASDDMNRMTRLLGLSREED